MKYPIFSVLLSVLMFSLPWLAGGAFWWTVLGAFVPLFMLRQRGVKHLLWWTLLTFFLWIMATCWWVSMSTLIALFAVPVVGLCFTFVPFALWHKLSRRASEALQWVLLVALWITFEAAYMYGEVSFPWLTLGHAFADAPWVVQWYSATGVFGGSLWVLIVNILVFKAVQVRSWCGNGWMWTACGAVLVPVIVSSVMYLTYNEVSNPVNVAVIQPNIDPYNEKFGGMSNQQQLDLLLSLAAEAPASTQFMVAPETALNDDLWIGRLPAAPSVDAIRRFMAARYPSAVLVVGATTLRAMAESEPTDYETYGGGSVRFKVFNSSLWIDSAQQVEVYHKSKLVCGVETIAYPAVFGALSHLLQIDLGGMGGHLGRSAEREVFHKTGTAICYESVYGEYFTQYIRQGAELMFIITNDGWWGDTPGYHQHLSLARLRAVETRRSIARSANTGISALINQRGDILQSLGWDQQGVISGAINANPQQTIYVRAGDYIARLAIYILALSLLYHLAVTFRRKSRLVD